MALPPLPAVKLQGLNPAYTVTTKDGKPDPNFMIQFNQLINSLVAQINAIVVSYNTATAAQDAADTAQGTADDAQTTADTAQDGVDALTADQYVIAAPSPDLMNARVLTPSAGVTFDTGTAAQIAILVDALAILNDAAVVLTQNLSTTGTFSAAGAVALGAGVKVTGLTETDTLQIDTPAVVAITPQTAYVPVNINGVVYKMLLG